MPKEKKNPHAVALGRKGGKRRVQSMTPEELRASAQKAARVRWAQKRSK